MDWASRAFAVATAVGTVPDMRHGSIGLSLVIALLPGLITFAWPNRWLASPANFPRPSGATLEIRVPG